VRERPQDEEALALGSNELVERRLDVVEGELELTRTLAPAHRQLGALDPGRVWIDQHGRELRRPAFAFAGRAPEHQDPLGEVDPGGDGL